MKIRILQLDLTHRRLVLRAEPSFAAVCASFRGLACEYPRDLVNSGDEIEKASNLTVSLIQDSARITETVYATDICHG